MGDNYVWVGGDGAFDDNNQWDDLSTIPQQYPANQPPGSGDYAEFFNGGTVSGGGNVAFVDIEGVAVTFTGQITTGDGGLEADGGANVTFASGAALNLGQAAFGIADGSAGTIDAQINGGDVAVQGSDLQVGSGGNISLTAGAGNFTVGAPVSVGVSSTFELQSGGTVSDTVAVLGSPDGATATVSGGNWSNASGMAIGLFGTGTLDITSGTVSVASGSGDFLEAGEGLAIGALPGDSGTVNVSGGALLAQSSIVTVGGQGSGALTISAGGSVNFGGTLDVGVMSGGDGTLSMDGGGATLAVGSAMIVGDAGSGTGTISGGASASVSSGLTIGSQSGGSGTLTMTGGGSELSVDNNATIGASGSGALNISGGGDFKLNSGFVVIGAGQSGSGTLTLNGSGSTLDASNDMTVGALGSGTLLVQSGAVANVSSGVLELGASPNANGVINLSGQGSTLTVQLNGTIGDAGTGTLAITSGATYTNSGGTTTLGGDIGGTGSMSVSGEQSEADLGTLNVGGPGDGTLTVGASGSVIASQDITIAAGTNSLSNLTVSGQSADLRAEANVTVGEGGDGNLTVQSTGSVGINSGSLVVADAKGSNGDVEIGGGMEVGQGLTVGNSGDGTVDVLANGTLTIDAGTIEIGMATDGTGLFSLAGSGVSVTAPGNVIVGDSGDGTLQVAAGTTFDAGAGTITIGSAGEGSGEATISGSDASAKAGGLTIGAGGDGTLTINTGATMSTSDAVVIGQDADSSGRFDLDGDNSKFTDGGDLTVGASGDGTLSVQGGATVDVSSGAVVIGSAADSTGTITLAGTETPLSVGKDLTVGMAGDGTLDVQSGATLDVNSGAVTLGGSDDGSGEISLAGTGTVFSTGESMTVGVAGDGSIDVGAGATIGIGGSLDLGASNGGSGTISLSGSAAALSASTDVTVGDAGTGEVAISAGASLDAGSDTFTIGGANGGVGTVTVSGDDAAASLGTLAVGDSGKGTLTIGDGGQVTTSDDVVIGGSSVGSGTVTVNGDDSLLEDGGELTVGDSGTGELDINQGSIDVFNGVVTLGGSSGGSGTLNLQNASLDLSGSLTIGDGGSGSLEVGTDGDLKAQDIDLGGSANASGNLTVDGTGAAAQSSDLTIGDDGTGALEVSAQGSLDTTGQAVLGDSALPTVEQQASILGQAQWTIGSALDVGDSGNGAIAIGSGGQVFAGSVVLGDEKSATGTVTVNGTIGTSGGGSAASSLFYGGALTVGDTGSGTLTVSQGGVVGVAGAGTIDAGAESSGTGSISVSGTGSSLFASVLDVGDDGSGGLSVSGGATVTVGSMNAAISSAAVANISVSGTLTALKVTGNATVGDDGSGVMSVLSGATVDAANLTIGSQGDSSGALVVSGNGSIVNVSGELNVGTALGTGDLTIGPGATVNALVVSLQGEVVLENGELDPTVNLINQGQTAGGSGTIAAGDIVDEGVIQAGGSKPSQKLLVVAGTVLGGGPWTINGTAQSQANGDVGVLQINAGGTLELTGAVLNAASTTFTDDVTPRSTYTVNDSVVDVNFEDATGVLKVDDIGGFAGTIVAFRKGDEFVITGGTLSGPGVTGGNTLTVSDSGNGGTDQIIFGSGISAGGFSIVNNNTIQVACFAAGTRIATGTGMVAVEDLRVGDRVIKVDGQAGDATKAGLSHAKPAKGNRAVKDDGTRAPIVWIGRRKVNCRAHPKPDAVWPVRVSAGAFGMNVPVRDLYLSPDHAVFANGVLVPVKLLVNGTSIIQVKRNIVTYYHVELPTHAVILAEGLTVESYLDLGDRMDFATGNETIRLFSDFAARLAPDAAMAWETKGAAPQVMAGEKLDAVRTWLAGIRPKQVTAKRPTRVRQAVRRRA